MKTSEQLVKDIDAGLVELKEHQLSLFHRLYDGDWRSLSTEKLQTLYDIVDRTITKNNKEAECKWVEEYAKTEE